MSVRTQRESERRQRLIDNMNYRYKQMEISIENPDIDRRSALLGNPSHSMYGTNNYGDIEANGETTAARNITADEFRQQKQLLMKGIRSCNRKEFHLPFCSIWNRTGQRIRIVVRDHWSPETYGSRNQHWNRFAEWFVSHYCCHSLTHILFWQKSLMTSAMLWIRQMNDWSETREIFAKSAEKPTLAVSINIASNEWSLIVCL